MWAFDAYLYLLTGLFVLQTVPVVPDLLPAIASPTLPVIQSFLGSPTGTVGAWNHMILGDLWIGRWVCHDAIKLETPAYLRLPILIVILFFGPLGLALYLAYRLIFKKRFRLSTEY